MAKLAVIMICVMALFRTYAAQTLLEADAERSSRFPCMGAVTYRVEVNFAWSAATHGDAYPENGGLSPHVVASHGKFYTMWAPLGFSSEGVQDVAETGNPDQLEMELMNQRKRNVFSIRVEDGPSSGTARRRAAVKVNGGRSYISSIAMMAPSPDWFTGIEAVNMCNEETGEFYDEMTGNLSAWDAGTDAGTEFTSEDVPLSPAQRMGIRSILNTRFNGVPIGTYKIMRM